MKQYSNEEILDLIKVTKGDEAEQATALAVVVAAIKESRKLGRLAVGKPNSTWHKNSSMLRSELSAGWTSSSKPGL